MKIVHQYSEGPIVKKVDGDRAFLLINDKKDFVSFYSKQQTRYEGFFVRQNDDYLKIISNIEVKGEEAEEILLLHLFSVTARKYKNFWESFFFIKDSSVLVYELSCPKDITVSLDVRSIFAAPKWGRNYEINKTQGGVVIKYFEEGQSDAYVALISNGNAEIVSEWKEIIYMRDAQRNSVPNALYEYEAVKFVGGSRLVAAYGLTKKEALTNAKNNSDITKIDLVINSAALKPRKQTDKKLIKTAAYVCRKTLDDLFEENGIMAGLPWFDHPWSRDELISLPVLTDVQIKKIVKKYVKASWNNAKVPVILGSLHSASDSLGILCWAIMHKGIKLTIDEKIALAHKLINAIDYLEQTENNLYFVYSNSNESWMDSIPREGYLIEIQALYSKILELAYYLTGDNHYDNKRASLLKNIRMYFYYDHGNTVDLLGELTARPNVFLAAFFAPEIHTKKEWEKCFDPLLPKIWLGWGGLASIDKKDDKFIEVSTGQNNLSYHNGDSWFFVNNIAALVLKNTNNIKYSKVIKKILMASTEEILWHNFAGRPGEISSAKSLDSWGCGAQAFSASTYLYLVNNYDIRKNNFK